MHHLYAYSSISLFSIQQLLDVVIQKKSFVDIFQAIYEVPEETCSLINQKFIFMQFFKPSTIINLVLVFYLFELLW